MSPKKAVTVTATYGAIWLMAMLLFLPVLFPLLQAPVALSGWILVLGAAMWAVIFSFQIKKELRKIDQQKTDAGTSFGLSRALTITFVAWLALMGLVLFGFYIAYYQPFLIFLINILIPCPAAMSLTAAVRYWHWEHRNNKTLLVEYGRMYAKPQVSNTT